MPTQAWEYGLGVPPLGGPAPKPAKAGTPNGILKRALKWSRLSAGIRGGSVDLGLRPRLVWSTPLACASCVQQNHLWPQRPWPLASTV